LEEVFYFIGETDFLKAEEFVGDLAEDHAVVALAFENAGTEAGFFAESKAEVGTAVFGFEAVEVLLGGDGFDVGLDVVGDEGGTIYGGDVAVNAQRGGATDVEVEVGGSGFNDEVKELFKCECGHGIGKLDVRSKM
jgi:hypothetical protein